MAKLEKTLTGNFDELLSRIEQGVMKSSFSASIEDKCDFTSGKNRVAVRVFERYSAIGQNRVSLNITLFQGEDGVIRLCAITSGGSQAIFFKFNTFGEKAFLSELEKIL